MNPFARQIGERIRLAREEKGQTQEWLTSRLGISDRQTVSSIETGIRQLKPEELTKICSILDKPLDFFTNPYIIAEPHAFSYRAKPDSKEITAFEKKAHKLIAANRRFRELLSEPATTYGNKLRNLNRQSTLNDARQCGESTSDALGLGQVPALELREKVENKMNVMVLFVDAPDCISGAACHLSDGDFIMINRNEASFRRNFDLGHELFHILTWDTMPPGRLDVNLGGSAKTKVEKMADAFTSALLMPSEGLRARWSSRTPTQDIHEWILQTAREFRVSGPALHWRMINAGIIAPKDAQKIKDANLSRSDDHDADGKPNLYNAEFARRVNAVLARGLVSARKAVELLELDHDEIVAVLEDYNYAAPFAL